MHNIELEAALKPATGNEPAKWPYEPGACDCAPDVDVMDPPCRPMTRTEARWLVVIYVLSTVAVVSAIAAVIQ